MDRSISGCNRALAQRIIPQTVSQFNAGRFGEDYYVFERKEFYRNVLLYSVSKSAVDPFIDSLIIERGKWKGNPLWEIVCLTTPNTKQIRETACIGIIIDPIRKEAIAYTMEHYTKDYKVCEWDNGLHFRYGIVSSKSDFISKIISLTLEKWKPDEKDIKYPDFSATPPPPTKKKQSKVPFWKRKYANLPGWVLLLFAWAVILIVIVLVINISSGSSTEITGRASSFEEADSMAVEPLSDIATNPSEDNHFTPSEDYSGRDSVVSSFDYFKVKILYDALKEDGVDVGSEEEFYDWFFTPGKEGYENRKYAYEAHKNNRADLGKSYEDFKNNWLQLQPVIEGTVAQDAVNIKYFKNGDKPYANWFGKGRYDRNSLSSLTISNQTDCDAVVILYSASGNVVRHSFVKKHSSYTMTQIPSIKAIIKVMQGNDWNTLKDNGSGYPQGGFMNDVSFSSSSWNDPFEYVPREDDEGVNYPSYSITLHAVPNGNFQTSGSSSDEFFEN